MHYKSNCLRLMVLFFFFSNCSERESFPEDKFFVKGKGTNDFSLFYKFYEGGGIVILHEIDSLGWTNKYIFAKCKNEIFWIDKMNDSVNYNYDEMVNGPITEKTIKKLMVESKVDKLYFQIGQ